MIAKILLTLGAFLGMELVAWLTHKFIMHGFLWSLHRDHHVKEDVHSKVEKNDSFFLVFAIPAMLLFAASTFGDVWWALYLALGITLYGVAYFLIHDVFIHQRIKIFRRVEGRYFKAIRRAHKMHHKHVTKEHGECFGMLWVPWKYFKETVK